MNKFVELPLAEPMYGTYHYQGPSTAVAVRNPSIRNWILNEVMILACTQNFLSGRTTPDADILKSSWRENPYLERIYYPFRFAGGYINAIIRNLLDHDYYVFFEGVDDFYVQGKSWYRERNFAHDGMICGYNRGDSTYCMYAYDSRWVYRKFWTPQQCFDKGREAFQKIGGYGGIYGIHATSDSVEFSPEAAYKSLLEYLDSSFEKYPISGEGTVYGIVVQEYLAMYVGKLYEGFIPFERMDRRVFRLIWEHKKVMLERIAAMEKAWRLEPVFSKQYEKLVSDANTLRMLYASHHMRRHDSVLPTIQKGLLRLKGDEERILTAFTDRVGEVMKNEAVEQPEKENACTSGADGLRK